MSVLLRDRPGEWTWARRNGLFLANATVFLLCFVGMVLAGWRVSVHDALLHREAVESLWGSWRAVTSPRRRSRTGRASSSRWGRTWC